MAETYKEVDERLNRLTLRGARFKADVVEAVQDASISITTEDVTQLTINLADPDLLIARSGLATVGTFLDYEDLRMVVAKIGITDGPAGTGGLTIVGRSEVVRKLKRRRGALNMRKASPSDFVIAECKAVGAKYVVQPTATRAQVSRDVPAAGQQNSGSEYPSSWTTFQRLKDEVGFLCYEVAGTVYFGQPLWLIKTLPVVRVGWGDDQPEAIRCLTVPNIEVSEDAVNERQVTLALPHQRAMHVRPGATLDLVGMPPGFGGKFLVTSTSFDLAGESQVDITAVTPRNPVPQGEQTESTSSSGSTQAERSGGTASRGGPVEQTGTKSVNDFVTACLKQAGDRYVLGAEARASDPDPDAFDCSELIEWACARVGYRFVDGSRNQFNFCKNKGTVISVGKAVGIRGALCFNFNNPAPGTAGHVAVMLGDGRTIEARGRQYGVVVGSASPRRFTHAALIPGLKYPPTAYK